MESKKNVKAKPVILSIESDYFSQLLLRKTLKKYNYPTVLAATCAEGITLLDEDQQISICVIDLDFPKEDLHSFFKHLTKDKKHESIKVFVTGENTGTPLSEIVHEKHLDTKMIAGLYEKPVDFSVFVEKLAEASAN